MSLTAAIGSLYQKFVFGLILKVRGLNLIVEKHQNHGDSQSPRVYAIASEPGSRAQRLLWVGAHAGISGSQGGPACSTFALAQATV